MIRLFKIIVYFLLIFVMAACSQVKCLPSSGVWYCDDLQIQIPFEEGKECYAIINDVKIICTWENDRGSKNIDIICHEANDPRIAKGEVIFSGKCISLDNSRLIVKDLNSDKEYIFECIN